MNSLTFIILNFFVAFFSDIILNFLSSTHGSWILKNRIINSLQGYFKKRSITRAAIDAGFTVLFVLLIVMVASQILLGYKSPSNLSQLLLFSLFGFILGFIADVLIDKWKLYGSDLDAYYKEAGAGFWGALALVFSINASYILEKLFF
jgi:hypothetical protein